MRADTTTKDPAATLAQFAALVIETATVGGADLASLTTERGAATAIDYFTMCADRADLAASECLSRADERAQALYVASVRAAATIAQEMATCR